MSKSVIELCAESIDKVSKENFCGDGIEYDSRLFAKAVLTTLATNLDQEAFRASSNEVAAYCNNQPDKSTPRKLLFSQREDIIRMAIQAYLNTLIKEEKL